MNLVDGLDTGGAAVLAAVDIIYINRSLNILSTFADQETLNMPFASAFISHKSGDKDIVEPIVKKLGLYGIAVWYDNYELEAGTYLDDVLPAAVKQQTVLVLFMSRRSMQSPWVKDVELLAAHDDVVIPVFIDEPHEVLKSDERLQALWLMENGKIRRNGIPFDFKKDEHSREHDIAKAIAHRIYTLMGFRQQRDVLLYLDHRGTSIAANTPELNDELSTANLPALLFRPVLGERSGGHMLPESDWTDIKKAMNYTLGESLGDTTWPEKRTIRIAGKSQLSIPYLLGQYFDRNTNAKLYCYASNWLYRFDNVDYPHNTPLEGGEAYCDDAEISEIRGNISAEKIALLLMPKTYSTDARTWINTHRPDLKVVYVETIKTYETNQQVKSLCQDIVALLQRLRKENQLQEVYFFTSLPFSILPILASSLHHLANRNKTYFMEFDRDNASYQQYDFQLPTTPTNASG